MFRLMLEQYNRSGCYHAGIIFNYSNKEDNNVEPYLMHLDGHHSLALEKYSEYQGVIQEIQPGLCKENLILLTALFKKVADANDENKIPYGFGHSSKFDVKNGIWMSVSSSDGLTCATFVLALYRSLALEIIDAQSWKIRDSDKQWQAHVIRCLRSNKAIDQNYVDDLEKNIGNAFRIRPAEIIASGERQENEWSVDFVGAVYHADHLINKFPKAQNKS